MLTRTKTQLGRIVPLISFLIGIPALSWQPLRAQEPRNIQVFDFDPHLDRHALTKALKAYENGDIVRVAGASQADIVRLFGGRLGTFKVFSEARSTLIDFSRIAKNPNRLTFQGVAGYKDANGIVHTVQSFAAADPIPTRPQGEWRRHLDEWVEARTGEIRSDHRRRSGTSATSVDNALHTTTVQATSRLYGNFEQSTIAVYRLVTTNPENDYYMVYTVPEVRPNYDGSCDGFAECGWHTILRTFVSKAAEATELTDHGPTGTIGSETAGFNIGGSLSPAGPGVSAAFSATWSQPDVTTVDNSTGSYGQWNETFHFDDAFRCNPAFGSLPLLR